MLIKLPIYPAFKSICIATIGEYIFHFMLQSILNIGNKLSRMSNTHVR